MNEQNTLEEKGKTEIEIRIEKELFSCLLPALISMVVYLAAYNSESLGKTITLCCVASMISLYALGRYFIFKYKQ